MFKSCVHHYQRKHHCSLNTSLCVFTHKTAAINGCMLQVRLVKSSLLTTYSCPVNCTQILLNGLQDILLSVCQVQVVVPNFQHISCGHHPQRKEGSLHHPCTAKMSYCQCTCTCVWFLLHHLPNYTPTCDGHSKFYTRSSALVLSDLPRQGDQQQNISPTTAIGFAAPLSFWHVAFLRTEKLVEFFDWLLLSLGLR